MVTSTSLNTKSLFLFFSIFVPIANQKSISALKASKISVHLLLKNSQDPSVSGCVPKLTLGRLKMLFCLVKITLKSIKSVERIIITCIGLDTPPHPKSFETNLQNITRDIFQTTTNQLMTSMPSVQFTVQGQ